LNNLYICDSVENWHFKTDTSVLMMKEVARRDQFVYICTISDLALDETTLKARVSKISFNEDEPFYSLSNSEILPLDYFHLIHLRMDPPVDMKYIHSLMLLDIYNTKNQMKTPVIINKPGSVLRFNEKIINYHFPDFNCPTIVSADALQLSDFIEKYREVVVKPIDDCSGKGVIRMSAGSDIYEKLEKITDHGNIYIMVQEYLSAVEKSGDVRVLIINGKILSVMKRLPAENNFCCNLAQGATCHKLILSEEEKSNLSRLCLFLVENGLYFVAVDMIGGKLCEINLTSPGLVTEMNELNNVKLEVEMQDIFESLIV
ncbi:hypothetical protein KAJ27_20660, partial [bacterium]|nr:hypothetical protein [bacterium]